MTSRRGNGQGFTLVELLVVIAIIGILVALLLPAIQAAREAARRTQCSNNIKQMAMALHNYHDTYQRFPPGNIVQDHWKQPPTNACHRYGSPGICCGSIGLPAFILPFMEQQPLYDRIDFTRQAWAREPGEHSYHEGGPTNGNHGDAANQYAAEHMPPVFKCPAVPDGCTDSENHKDYAVNGCNGCCDRFVSNGVFHVNSGNPMSRIVDGTSQTFLILELSHNWKKPTGAWFTHGANPFFWVNHATQGYAVYVEACNFPPNSITCRDVRGARSFHPGGLNVCFADASVRYMSENVDFGVYGNTFTISRRESETLSNQ
jgi:prepilin-type N-terminal cleavage/methylation domain-containing protein/prepilin-type processing-associated H-X9-DG protein